MFLIIKAFAVQCEDFYNNQVSKSGRSHFKSLKDSRLEEDRFEIAELVDPNTMARAEALVDRYPKAYGDKSFRIIVFGGSQRPVSFIKDFSPEIREKDLPPEIREIVLDHLERLKNYFLVRFPNKKFDFTSAEIRISNDGSFDVSHLHLDFGGFDDTISTSTTFNSTGIGTYVARKENIISANNETANNQTELLPLEYREDDSSWKQIPGFGFPVSSLQKTQVGETLLIQRVKNGLINSKQALVGKKGPEKQKAAIESGVWHSSPGLIPSEARAHPRRFWIGVIATFY